MAITFQKRTNPTSANLKKTAPDFYKKNPFPFNESTGGNCTWYAWGRFCEVWHQVDKTQGDTANQMWNGTPNGNACEWVNHVASHPGRFTTGTTPRPGAIICWGYNGRSLGHPGHVAFVEEVFDDGSIEVSQSGWSGGNLRNQIIAKGDGKVGTKAYKFNSSTYFNGFIYNPIDFVDTNTIDMRRRIDKLYSSDNYNWITKEEEEDSRTKLLRESSQYLANSLAKLKEFSTKDIVLLDNQIQKSKNKADIERSVREISRSYGALSMSEYNVEAPMIELDLGGYTIGSYKGSTERYPNYLTSMEVTKVNGEINKYSITVVHQIRTGEDPNLIDRLLSTVRYNEIEIRYGDCNSGQLFRDEKAIITNVSMNRDYASSRITYKIEATSAGELVSSRKMTFHSKSSRPSDVIRWLLYENSATSTLLLNAFPGMRNRTLVESNHLLPNDDIALDIAHKQNIGIISYINYLVASMSSNTNDSDAIIRNSTYYIHYMEDDGVMGGAYFKIDKLSSAVKDYVSPTNTLYYVTVGYPDNNNVMSFNVNSESCWSLLYNTSLSTSNTTIDSFGNIKAVTTSNLMSSSNYMNEIDKNWWTQMVNFPVNAELTVKGLLKPLMITDYIYINVVFYGHKHLTSGLYAIVGQKDTLSGNGFRTTLSLTRIGNEESETNSVIC